MPTNLTIFGLLSLGALGAYLGLGGSLGHPLRAVARLFPFGRTS